MCLTCLPPVTNCHTFSDPLDPSSVTYFMDGPNLTSTLPDQPWQNPKIRLFFTQKSPFLSLQSCRPTGIAKMQAWLVRLCLYAIAVTAAWYFNNQFQSIKINDRDRLFRLTSSKFAIISPRSL